MVASYYWSNNAFMLINEGISCPRTPLEAINLFSLARSKLNGELLSLNNIYVTEILLFAHNIALMNIHC